MTWLRTLYRWWSVAAFMGIIAPVVALAAGYVRACEIMSECWAACQEGEGP